MIESRSEAETEQLGRKLAPLLQHGDIIGLTGDLGAGKTVFSRGVLRGLGVTESYLTSPTFALVQLYNSGRLPVCHFDLYRLTHPDALTMLGADACLEEGEGVALIEWAERGHGSIPEEYLLIRINHSRHDANRRILHPNGVGTRGHLLMQQYGHLC